MHGKRYPNVVISKWTTRRGAGGQKEKEYVDRVGQQYECNYFKKQANILPTRFRFKPKKTRALSSTYSTLTTLGNSPVKKTKAKAATAPSRAAKGKKKACYKDTEEGGLDEEHDDDGNSFEGGAISVAEDVGMKAGLEGVDGDQV